MAMTGQVRARSPADHSRSPGLIIALVLHAVQRACMTAHIGDPVIMYLNPHNASVHTTWPPARASEIARVLQPGMVILSIAYPLLIGSNLSQVEAKKCRLIASHRSRLRRVTLHGDDIMTQ
jgi:hypothetical protein